MRHHVIITLKPSRAYPEGRTLTVEYPDRATAETLLRSIERFRKYRWGLPEIYVVTVDGSRECLSYLGIVWPVVLEPVAVPAS